MVAPELKLAKKVTADKEERDHHCQGLWLKERQRLNPEDSTFCLRTLKLTDTLEAAQAAQRLHRMGKRQSHIMTNAESETIIERTLTGKARMNAYKDRIAETQRVKERKRAGVERGAGDVPMEPGNRDDEQMGQRVGRQYDSSKKLRVHHLLPEVQLGPCMCIWSILRVVRDKIGRGPHLSRS